MTEVNITKHKQAFLTSQIRLLSTPLTTPTSSINIPPTTLDPLLNKINQKIASQNRLTFGLQSQRHVAEQIDALYWQEILQDGLPASTNNNDTESTLVKRNVDLTDTHKVESSLAEDWNDVCLRPRKRQRRRGEFIAQRQKENENDHNADGQISPHDDDHDSVHDEDERDNEGGKAEQYESLREQLLQQTKQRDDLRRKLAKYKKLQELLQPLENAKENVQPNLITKDNKDIDAELVRMRVLLARAGNALQVVTGTTEYEGNDDVEETPEGKLESVLALG